jgi:hypothetical protein
VIDTLDVHFLHNKHEFHNACLLRGVCRDLYNTILCVTESEYCWLMFVLRDFIQIAGASHVVKSGGCFVLYGPFKINGKHTGTYVSKRACMQ